MITGTPFALITPGACSREEPQPKFLPVIEIGEQVDRIDAGDAIGVDLSKGIVYNLTKNEQYQGTELPQFIQDIAAAGGLVNFAKHRK